MKKIINKISLVLTALLTIFIIASIIIGTLFSENIESAVINNLKKQVNNSVKIGEVEFKMFEKFPFSTVKIEGLYIQEDSLFGEDTLIYAKLAYVEFNPLKILTKNITINNITLYGGIISVKYNIHNTSNYNRFNTQGNSNISLEKIKLINSHLKYSSLYNNSVISLACKDLILHIDKSANKVSINGDAFSEEILIHEKNYINNKEVEVDLNIQYSKDKTILKESNLKINDLNFSLYGSLDSNNYIDLSFTGDNHKISSIINNTPNHLKHIYSSILADGIIKYTGEIKGLLSKKRNPHLEIEYNISKGVFETKRYPFYLSEISCSGNINNGNNNNFEETAISFNNFHGRTRKGSIDGQFVINNLNNYSLNADFNSTWNMEEANYYFIESPFFECDGVINARTKYIGGLSFDEKFNIHFTNSEHFSEIKLSEIEFLYRDYPLKIHINKAECEIKNNTIDVKESNIKIKDSDLEFKGKITSLFKYILLDNKDIIEIDGDLIAKTINLKKLTERKKEENDVQEAYDLPNFFTLQLNTEIESLSYNNIYPNNINGILNYKDQALTAEKLKLNLFNGNMLIDGKFYKNNANNFKLTNNIRLDNIDINKAFVAFDNFGQDFIKATHLKGICSSNIICNASWDNFLNFKAESLDVESKISIKDGELINFTPLESVSNFVKLEDLSHVRFSKLENEIRIKDKIISVPKMEINSSALSLLISGKHYFNQEYNYKISLLLSELLTKRFRKKSDNFSPSDSTRPVKTNLQLRMTGNKDNSEISFEKLKIKENIKNEIKKEILDINKIISEEINNKEVTKENDDIEIEWEDNL